MLFENWYKDSAKYGILKPLQKSDCDVVLLNGLADLLGMEFLEL